MLYVAKATALWCFDSTTQSKRLPGHDAFVDDVIHIPSRKERRERHLTHFLDTVCPYHSSVLFTFLILGLLI